MPDDDAYDYGQLPVEQQQETMYELIGFTDEGLDEYAHAWFYEAMYNNDLSMADRLQVMDELADYLFDEYGIDFEAMWDWDDFRDWYASQ
jgi:hypothetical protein